MTRRPHYEGDPSLLRVMLRPRWIAALLLALAVAGGFAWLGKWQLEHAVATDHADVEESETAVPLAELTDPATPVGDASAGMVASLTAAFVPNDFLVVEQRKNDGRVGAWVTGHALVILPGGTEAHLAVAIGWAPTPEDAERAIAELEGSGALTGDPIEFEGRYMPSDATVLPGAEDDPMRITSMAPAQLVNVWEPFDGPAYGGYLVLHPDSPAGAISAALEAAGLDAIDSVPPLPADTINWLNLFYAVEWVVFAGFAVFFWYRLSRDAWEKEHELALAELQADSE